ncbi:MAG: hypothetical protein QM766_13995 [Burkholderiaceae bacterium]
MLVSNVVNAAIEEASLRAQIATTRDLIELATRLLDISRRQHRAGQVGGVDVAAQEAALALVQAQASRYTNTVALYQALGGWWQLPELAGDQANRQ